MKMCLPHTLLLLLISASDAPSPTRWVQHDFPYSLNCLAFSPDGKMLATGTHSTENGKDAVRLWDVASNKELFQLGPFKFGCSALAFSPDGKTLVTNGGPDSTILLWDLATQKVRLTIKPQAGVGGSLAVSPDGKWLAASGRYQTGFLWDMKTGKVRAELNGYGQVHQVTFSPNGQFLATCAGPGLVMLWDVPSGKERANLIRHELRVESTAFSPDSKILYSLGRDRLVVCWDVATGKEKRTINLRGQYKQVPHYMALSPDGTVMAILGSEPVRLLDLGPGTLREGVKWDYQLGYHSCLAFSPDGKFLATGSGGKRSSNSVYLWNVPARKADRR